MDPLVIREIVREEMQDCRSASLPSPELLAECNKVDPGMAERILGMAERSVIQKIDRADKLASAEIESAKTSWRAAVSVIVLAFAVAVVAFALRYQVAGIAFVAISVAAFIRLFMVAAIHRARLDEDARGTGQPR